MLALLVGLVEIGLGLGKLGFVADLLSSEVQVGYMNGLGITIIVGQLPKLFGFSTDADGFLQEIEQFFRHIDETRRDDARRRRRPCSSSLLVLPRVLPRVPAILVAVVGVTIVSAVLDLAADGVATGGLAPPRRSDARRCPGRASTTSWPLLIAAFGITLVSLTDTIATATSFAARRGDEVDPDQEMIGLGAANLAAGLFQGFSVSTSGSRTAVAEQSGAKSQLTGVVGAGLVVVLLLFLNSLLADLPQTALAAVVITAALSLMDFGVLRRYARVRDVVARPLARRDGRRRALRGARGHRHRDRAVGLHVLPAQLVAPRRGARARSTASTAGTASRPIPRRVSCPASSCTGGRRRSSSPTPARSERRSGASPATHEPAWIVLQCEAITDIDVTAADMLKLLDDELNAQGIHVAFAEMRSRLQDLIVGYGLLETLDRDHFYPTLDAALAEIRALGTSDDATEQP